MRLANASAVERHAVFAHLQADAGVELHYRNIRNRVAGLRSAKDALAVRRTGAALEFCIGQRKPEGHRQTEVRAVDRTEVIANLELQTQRADLAVIRAVIDHNPFAALELFEAGSQIFGTMKSDKPE